MPEPRASTPTVRRIAFEFPADLNPVWHRQEPEWAAMINGASLTMPYLEPFLIRTMREAAAPVTDPDLRIAADAFVRQEGQHFRAHRHFNELLKTARYPELAAVEARMESAYARLDRRSLRKRMAYTAGFESMTTGLTRWLVEDRVRLFAGADSRVTSLLLWQLVGEAEHKCVAFDIYQARFGGGLSGYLARMLGVFHGSLDVMRFSMQGYKCILRKDGRWRHWRSRLRLAGWLTRFMANVGPSLLRAALPGHSPHRDPPWVQQWLRLHDPAADSVPLIDTDHPDMPVPFQTTTGKEAS